MNIKIARSYLKKAQKGYKNIKFLIINHKKSFDKNINPRIQHWRSSDS